MAEWNGVTQNGYYSLVCSSGECRSNLGEGKSSIINVCTNLTTGLLKAFFADILLKITARPKITVVHDANEDI